PPHGRRHAAVGPVGRGGAYGTDRDRTGPAGAGGRNALAAADAVERDPRAPPRQLRALRVCPPSRSPRPVCKLTIPVSPGGKPGSPGFSGGVSGCRRVDAGDGSISLLVDNKITKGGHTLR